MRYGKVVEAKFLNRPNRFIAEVAAEEGTCAAHVKNTGRCRELLIPGCTVYLSVSDHPGRKTKYDLICVEKTRDAKSPLLGTGRPRRCLSTWIPRFPMPPPENGSLKAACFQPEP